MFPWMPLPYATPPYWVCNLLCNGQRAEPGMPHIRCIGMRLQPSDPMDAPPAITPSGYQFCGQSLLSAIEYARRPIAEAFGRDVLLSPVSDTSKRPRFELKQEDGHSIPYLVIPDVESSRALHCRLPFFPECVEPVVETEIMPNAKDKVVTLKFGGLDDTTKTNDDDTGEWDSHTDASKYTSEAKMLTTTSSDSS